MCSGSHLGPNFSLCAACAHIEFVLRPFSGTQWPYKRTRLWNITARLCESQSAAFRAEVALQCFGMPLGGDFQGWPDVKCEAVFKVALRTRINFSLHSRTPRWSSAASNAQVSRMVSTGCVPCKIRFQLCVCDIHIRGQILVFQFLYQIRRFILYNRLHGMSRQIRKSFHFHGVQRSRSKLLSCAAKKPHVNTDLC